MLQSSLMAEMRGRIEKILWCFLLLFLHLDFEDDDTIGVGCSVATLRIAGWNHTGFHAYCIPEPYGKVLFVILHIPFAGR